MVYKQFCVSIAAGKTQFSFHYVVHNGADVADVTYQRYLRCVVLETRHYADANPSTVRGDGFRRRMAGCRVARLLMLRLPPYHYDSGT